MASSNSSTRKGKKSNNSDKPKQPQRGLGVAQLEKIRLHSQMASYHPNLHVSYPTSSTNFNQEDMRVQAALSSTPSSSYSSSNSPSLYGFHHSVLPRLSHDHCERMIRYSDSQPITSWIPNEAPHFVQPSLDIHIHNVECSLQKRTGSMRSSSQNCDSIETQEVDLELRL